MADNNFEGLGDETLKNAISIKNSVNDIGEGVLRTNKALKALQEATGTYARELNTVKDSANKVADIQAAALKTGKATVQALAEQAKQTSLIRKLNAEIDDLYAKAATQTPEVAERLKQQARNLAEARDSAKELSNLYGKIADSASKLDGKTKFLTKLSDITKQIPILKGLSSPFEKAAEAARRVNLEQAKVAGIEARTDKNGRISYYDTSTGKARRITDQEGQAAMATQKQSATAQAAKAFGGEAMEGMGMKMGWIGIVIEALKLMWDIFVGAQKQTVEIARNMSLTRDGANEVRDSFQSIALRSGETYVNTTNLIKAQSELTNQLQNASVASENTLLAQTFLTERMKMAGEAAAVISARSEAIGENAQASVEATMHQNVLDVRRQKSFQTQQQLLKGVASTTGEIAAYFGYSNKAIAEGITRINRFGVGLQEAKNISEGLLNFESSIANELELELLSGKEFNMEKARVLAATGKQAEATEEVMKQMGKLTEEQRRQPMVLEAASKVLNITKDQVADAYLLEKDRTRQKEEYTKLLREGNDLEARAFASKHGFNQQEVADAKKIVTLEEQYKEALAKVKDQFMGLVSSHAIDKLTDLIKAFADTITKHGIGGMWSVFGKSEMQKATEAQQQKSAQSTVSTYQAKMKGGNYTPTEQEKSDYKYAQETLQSLTPTEATTGQAPGTMSQEFASDYISRPGQPITKFRPDDIIIGGTDPLGEKRGSTTGGGDYSAFFEKLLSAQERTITELQKRQSIYIGSNSLTEGIGIGSNKLGNT